jgi:predicted ATP-dependent endonuclease of OLD family
LKLLRLLKDCSRGSLVLIDELELALHPMAQVTLLSYLDDIAAEKALTIIVSTHSATLIKQANASRLLLLQEDATGNIICQDKCFPSLVLGALAYREETAADVIVYVEDEAAQVLVEQFAFRFMQHVYQNNQLVPSIQVIPVGGMTNVLRFFVRQRPLLPAITRCYVMLDADAEQTLNAARAEDIIRIRDRERAAISYLPVTPEVGLATFLHSSVRKVQDALRTHYRLRIAVAQQDVGALPAPNDRDACKMLVSRVCDVIAEQLPNVSSSDVKETLLQLLADHLFESERARIMRFMGPIIRG